MSHLHHVKRVAVLLLGIAGGACAASRAGAVRGEWGAPGALLDARESGGFLSYACRVVELHAPLVADAKGEIRVRGTAQYAGGAAPPPGGVPGSPVEIRGRRLRDERLQLVVAPVGASSGDTLLLSPGVRGTVTPCP